MPSIRPDFEYDIFISYRQNDNSSDKWVSNFVNALREELVATFKNPVSIYFDENPKDGLLETHQVDATLAKKLKSLIFIPIISQTYCDIKSFAWEQEFLPFVKMAKEDNLGINLTLSNGNVTSRVLPVKIHDLENEDQHALEAILDGPLRSVDFIYQEPGVNRPLSPKDNQEKNINKTLYKNQVNKVANALKDISRSIINQSEDEIEVPMAKITEASDSKSSKKGVFIGLAVVLIAFLSYWGYTQFYDTTVAEDRDVTVTIAVLAFDDQSPNGDQEWLGDGMADEILNVLAKVEGLQVTGKTSSFSFKGKGLTTKVIGETLNVRTVLEGSVIKIGDKLRITAQLIDVETDAHIWSKRYDRDATDIFNIVDEVAQSIAASLRSELSIEELEDIKVAYEVDPEAYEYYLKGFHIHWDNYIPTHNNTYFELSEKMFINALAIDSNYVDAYAGLADLYWSKSWESSSTEQLTLKYHNKRDSITNIGFKINPGSAYILMAKGSKFADPERINLDSAFYYYKKARDIDLTNSAINTTITDLLYSIGLFDRAIALQKRILSTDPLDVYVRLRMAWALEKIGKFDIAQEEFNKVLEIEANHRQALTGLVFINLFHKKNYNEARRLMAKIQQLDPEQENMNYKAWIFALDGMNKEALRLSKGFLTYLLLEMNDEALDLLVSESMGINYTPFQTYNTLKNSKVYDVIRDEQRFKVILANAEKVHEERMAKYGHLFDEE